MAGYWSRPDGGFEWRADVAPAPPLDPALSDPGPWLVARGEGRVRYPVLRRWTLLTQFARLAERPDEEHVLAFAERFGTLGVEIHGICETTPGEHRIRPAESLTTWTNATAEFLELWQMWNEAQVVRGHHQYRAERVEAARMYIKAHFKSDSTHVWFERASANGRHYDTLAARDVPALMDSWDGLQRLDPLLGPPMFYVYRQVNRQLRHKVNMAALPFQRGLVRFVPETLLAAIYIAFARHLADELPIERACEGPGCHLTLAVTRRNRRFCSHACLERARYHRKAAGAGAR